MNRAEDNGPPTTDRRISSMPSLYAGAKYRWNGIWAAPHLGFRALLHVPSWVRYRAVNGGHRGGICGGQNASSGVLRRDIFGGACRLNLFHFKL